MESIFDDFKVPLVGEIINRHAKSIEIARNKGEKPSKETCKSDECNVPSIQSEPSKKNPQTTQRGFVFIPELAALFVSPLFLNTRPPFSAHQCKKLRNKKQA